MFNAYQRRAYQSRAYQNDVIGVVSTSVLPNPVNCVLAGQQDMEVSAKTWEVNNGVVNEKIVTQADGVRKLGGESGFSTKTNNRGYD